MNKKNIINIVKMMAVLALATLLAFSFEGFKLGNENIFLIYVTSVLIIIIETKKFIYGAISGIVCVFAFNFFFVEPKFTFMINNPNYIISLIIFLIVSFVISTLTSRLQKQVVISIENEKRVNALYQISKTLLNIHSFKEIAIFELNHLEKYLNQQVIINFRKKKDFEVYANKEFISVNEYKEQINYSINNNIVCGKNEEMYKELTFKIFPIISSKGVFGTIIIECINDNITRDEIEFIQTNIAHMIVALEREKLSIEKENTRVQMEKEKFKASLLRSISHDLRTPLTSLATGTSFILDSYNQIDDETKKSILLDVNNETTSLAEFVDNLLNMTRIDANKLVIDKKHEMIEDILADVYNRIKKRLKDHIFHIISHQEMLYVYADSSLLIQVLVNLIDNAIKHTEKLSEITVKYWKEDYNIIFEISDNGGGIKEENLNTIFDDFTIISNDKQDRFRGMGLGLSICKAMIEAHNGKIKVYNNDIGGATFLFNIPIEKKDD